MGVSTTPIRDGSHHQVPHVLWHLGGSSPSKHMFSLLKHFHPHALTFHKRGTHSSQHATKQIQIIDNAKVSPPWKTLLFAGGEMSPTIHTPYTVVLLVLVHRIRLIWEGMGWE